MVHKKIGKQKKINSAIGIVIAAISLFSHHAECADKPHMTLSFFDDQNHACREATIGEHYRLEARLHNANVKHQSWPQITGLSADWIVGRQQQQEVSWLQGKKTESIYFVWEVVFNRPGTITIGPARCTDESGTIVESPSLSITVKEQQDISRLSPGISSAVSTFVRWEIDRLDPFVGEIVPIRLVFYTTDTSLQLESISEVNLAGAHLELTREPIWSSSVHNGLSYKTVTWSGILVARTPGVVSMPVVTISYREGARSKSSSPWAMMHHMLSAFTPVHHKRSSGLSLQVRSLPPTDHVSIGVGNITSVVRDVASMTSLRSGEAGTIIYRLQGTIHPHVLQLPVPEVGGSLAKIYNSTYKTQGAYPLYTYEQEYVIHPQEEGFVSLEEQILWYFNPEKEIYESHVIPRLEIEVLANPSRKQQQESPEQMDESKIGRDEKPDTHEISPETKDAKAISPFQPWLPFRWFLFFLLLPLIFVITKHWMYACSAYVYRKIRMAWVVRMSLRRINYAVQKCDGYELLQTMRHFIEHLCNISFDGLSHGALISDCLVKYGIKAEHMQVWHTLWDDLQKFAFGDMLSVQEYEKLGARCCAWIKMVYRLQR